jgi:hypothetical protein
MKGFQRVASRLRPRRIAVLSATVGAALVVAGGALAWHGFKSASAVSATFTAGTVTNSQSSTCTASNKDSIQVTNGTFSGTATSADPHLNGAITIEATSVFDTTTMAGTVSGFVRITPTSGPGFVGRLVTVNVNGQLQGMLAGDEQGAGPLLGNVSSVFSTTAGFGTSSSVATIGSGSGTDTAIVSTSGCQPQFPQGHGHDGGNLGGKHDFKTEVANFGKSFGRHGRHGDH